MQGVKYVIGDEGQAEAVIIDLAKHGRLWEDFQDLLVARSRRKEPRESLDDVKARLRKTGKLR